MERDLSPPNAAAVHALVTERLAALGVSPGQIADILVEVDSVCIVLSAAGAEADTISMGWYHSCLLKDAGVWCWGYNGYGQLGNNDRLAGCVIPRIPERARTLGNRHYRLVPSGSTDQLLVSPMVIRRAERAGGCRPS
jgi:Regulator of chromosome condensation (RCC1) repeat